MTESADSFPFEAMLIVAPSPLATPAAEAARDRLFARSARWTITFQLRKLIKRKYREHWNDVLLGISAMHYAEASRIEREGDVPHSEMPDYHALRGLGI